MNTVSAQSLFIAPEVLEMVLVNLLENSLQHGANRMRIHSERLEGYLQIGLQDNGAGISRENRNKIFTPFLRPAAMPAAPGWVWRLPLPS